MEKKYFNERLSEVLLEDEYIEKNPSKLNKYIKLTREIARKNFADNEIEAAIFVEFALEIGILRLLDTKFGESVHYLEDESCLVGSDDRIDEYFAYFEGENIIVLSGEKARRFLIEEGILQLI